MELKVFWPECEVTGAPVILKSGISWAGELELLAKSLVESGIPVGISQLRGCNEHGSNGLASMNFAGMVQAFAEDCQRFCDLLSKRQYLGPYVIAAYSFGAPVALQLCKQIQSGVLTGAGLPKSLILMAPGLRHRNPFLRELIRCGRVAPDDELEFVFGKTMSRLGDRKILEEAKNYIEHSHVLQYGKKYRDTPSTAIRILAEGMAVGWEIFKEGLGIPIWVATAAHDHHVPSDEIRSVKRPEITFWESFDTGHCLPLEVTAQLAERISSVSGAAFES